MSWEMDCRECMTSVTYKKLCDKCWSCFNCVDQCVDSRCIDCYDDDPVVQMKAIWERRRKPHIQYLLSTKSGHYMALESVCHCCEHAYKVIEKVKCGKEQTGDVMQHALESILRVHDFAQAASHGYDYLTCEKPLWGRKFAREIREFLLNPLKHTGVLPKWITFTNSPDFVGIRTILGHSTNISPAEVFDPDEWVLGMTEDGSPYWYKDDPDPIQWSDPEVTVKYSAKSLIRMLIGGLDTAYATFTDPNSTKRQTSWFSPANQGQFRGDIDKQRTLVAADLEKHMN